MSVQLHRNPQCNLHKIAKALGITLSELFKTVEKRAEELKKKSAK